MAKKGESRKVGSAAYYRVKENGAFFTTNQIVKSSSHNNSRWSFIKYEYFKNFTFFIFVSTIMAHDKTKRVSEMRNKARRTLSKSLLL